MDKIKQWPVPPIPNEALEAMKTMMNLIIDAQHLASRPLFTVDGSEPEEKDMKPYG